MMNKIFSITMCILFVTSGFLGVVTKADWGNPSFILEQTAHSDSVWVINSAISHSCAQEFILEKDALIPEVRVYLKIYSPHNDDFDFTIYVGLSDELTTTYTDWIWYEEISYSFSGPVNEIIDWECFCGINGEQNYVFSKNTPHYLMIYSPDVNSRLYISILGDSSNPYPNGKSYGEISTKYNSIEGKDVAFKLWGQLWTEEENRHPTKPALPSGPNKGLSMTPYKYSTRSTDPDGDPLRYYYDWGDGTDYGWIQEDPETGLGINSHIWKNEGIYQVRVKSIDTHDAESEWSDSLTVEIEKKIEHFAVIVEGGGDDDLQDVFKNDAILVWETFKDLGYDANHFYCLDQPTLGEMESVFSELAGKNNIGKLFVFIVDHGNVNSNGGGYVRINPSANGLLYESKLSEWLDKITYSDSCTIMLQCCHSGAFIDGLSGNNRIILTSTRADLNSHSYDYPPYYQYSFFVASMCDTLHRKMSYGDGFEIAYQSISSLIWLEDDPQIGDPSNIAHKTYPGYDKDDSDDDPITITKDDCILNNINFKLKFLQRQIIKILNLLNSIKLSN